MDFLKKLKSYSIIKLFGIGLLGVIFLTVAVSFAGFAFRTALFGVNMGGGYNSSQEMMDTAYTEDGMVFENQKFSARNIMPEPGFSTGMDAEDFEVTEYSGNIKTRKLDKVCEEIEELKGFDYVIFEDSQKSERYCRYSFKVNNDRAEEVLAVIKNLKPENLQANTSTIKTVVDDYTSEVEILEKKLASLESTLTNAQSAYDQITVLATRAQDVESLTKIIDSKIKLIERLTTERINIKEQIDRLNKSKAEQLDRLDYTFFRISVAEVLIIDVKYIKDSWVSELKQFVREFNSVLQDVTVNLAEFILRLLQFAIYLLIALFVAKYGWRLVKRIWK